MSNRPDRPTRSGNPSHASSGARRAGRRDRSRALPERTFLERYRGAIVSLAIAAVVVLVVGFVFVSATAKLYACSSIWQPPAGASGDRLGAPQDDMRNNHVGRGETVRYTQCPPASGPHYSGGGGPIQARFYGPNDATLPQGWIHNLEHGALVVLYSCDQGGCGDADLASLRELAANFPPSPVCNLAAGQAGPVIAQFEEMGAPFAAIVWDRVLYQGTLDIEEIKQFFATEGELTNPELQCPRPSPSPAPSPSAADSPSPSPAPSASPS